MSCRELCTSSAWVGSQYIWPQYGRWRFQGQLNSLHHPKPTRNIEVRIIQHDVAPSSAYQSWVSHVWVERIRKGQDWSRRGRIDESEPRRPKDLPSSTVTSVRSILILFKQTIFVPWGLKTKNQKKMKRISVSDPHISFPFSFNISSRLSRARSS